MGIGFGIVVVINDFYKGSFDRMVGVSLRVMGEEGMETEYRKFFWRIFSIFSREML